MGRLGCRYKNKKIEVKSCSYLQDWDQKNLTKIQWSGLKAESLYWSSTEELKKSVTKEYKADIYILSLLAHKETATLDILNLDQWVFFVLTREQVKEFSKDKGIITIASLDRNNVLPVSFDKLKQTIDSCY